MRERRCISLIERLKQGSELKSTLSIGKLFQRFMTRSVKKLDLRELYLFMHCCVNLLHGMTQFSVCKKC